MQRTKKVTEVYVTEASQLSSVKRISRATVINVPTTVWTRLIIDVPAELTLSSKIEDKAELHTSKLVFKECAAPDEEMHIPVYKIVLADGTTLLMGGYERPYPVRTYQRSYSSGNNDSQLKEATVTLTDVYSLPIIA